MIRARRYTPCNNRERDESERTTTMRKARSLMDDTRLARFRSEITGLSNGAGDAAKLFSRLSSLAESLTLSQADHSTGGKGLPESDMDAEKLSKRDTLKRKERERERGGRYTRTHALARSLALSRSRERASAKGKRKKK